MNAQVHGIAITRKACSSAGIASEELTRLFPYADQVEFLCPSAIQREDVAIIFVKFDRHNDALPYPRRDVILISKLSGPAEETENTCVLLTPDVDVDRLLSAIELHILPYGSHRNELSIGCEDAVAQPDGSILCEWRVYFSGFDSTYAVFFARLDLASCSISSVHLSRFVGSSADLITGAALTSDMADIAECRRSPNGSTIWETQNLLVEIPRVVRMTSFVHYEDSITTDQRFSLHPTGSKSAALALVNGKDGWEFIEFRGKPADGQRPGKLLSSSSWTGRFSDLAGIRQCRFLRTIYKNSSVRHFFLLSTADGPDIACVSFEEGGGVQDLVRLRLPGPANLFPAVSEDGTAFVGFDDAWSVKLVHWEQNEVEVLVLPRQQFENVDLDDIAVSYVNRERIRFHVPENEYYYDGTSPEFELYEAMAAPENAERHVLVSIGRSPGLEEMRPNGVGLRECGK